MKADQTLKKKAASNFICHVTGRKLSLREGNRMEVTGQFTPSGQHLPFFYTRRNSFDGPETSSAGASLSARTLLPNISKSMTKNVNNLHRTRNALLRIVDLKASVPEPFLACQSCLKHDRYCEYPTATWKGAMQQHRVFTPSATSSQEHPHIISAGNNVMPISDSVCMPVLSNGAEYPASHNNDFSQVEMVIEHRRGDIEPPGHMFSIGEFGFDSMGFMDLSQYVPSTGMDWIFCNSLPDTSIPLPSFLTPTYFGNDAPAAESSDYQQNHQRSDPVVPSVEQTTQVLIFTFVNIAKVRWT
jgi:hypothetical protein